MAWKLDNNKPIYVQLLEQLMFRIVSGELKLGDKLATVRELAAEAGVNPNTMQRALAELEILGLITTQRTAGRTITTNVDIIGSQRKLLACKHGKAYTSVMTQLGYTKQMAAQLILETED